MGFSRQEYWSGVPLPSPVLHTNARLIYFFKRLFFRAVLGLQQNWEGDIEISHILPAPHIHNLLHYQHHIRNGIFAIKAEPAFTHHYHPSPLGLTLGAVHSMSLSNCTSIIMHILRSVFIVLKSCFAYSSLPSFVSTTNLYYLHSFTSYRMSYEIVWNSIWNPYIVYGIHSIWNHTIYSLFR